MAQLRNRCGRIFKFRGKHLIAEVLALILPYVYLV